MTSTTTPGIIEHLDPATLLLETNVRTDTAISDAFLESIKQLGVLTPILGHRVADGTVQVRAGQRRTTAAIQVGLATVPVYVVNAAGAEAERIIEQLIENEQRTELTETDRIEAWKQLEFEGLSVAQIAKRTGTKRDRVKTGLNVAKAETGAALVDQGVTLDQAAILIEFADDAELTEELTGAAVNDPDYFPHAVERARRDRQERIAAQPHIDAARAAGYEILEEIGYYDESPYPLHILLTATGETVRKSDVEGKEGIAVYIRCWNGEPSIRYYVTDPTAHGFTINNQYGGRPAKGPMTDDQKSERKQLIENNKAWDAAETVRREWLAQFLSRKALPKNTVNLAAWALTENIYSVANNLSDGRTLACELLGVKSAGNHLAAQPGKAGNVLLAAVIATLEKSTSRQSWRYPDEHVAHYLAQVADWGYPLSPVEKIAAKITDETADEPDVAQQ
ncbi:ParB/RepB/Spo0J family partition protein [Leucobacter aridicollis]|uniref:ParB/RepB/Spo0J family partition protein n=1 Tax=Leucobacter aridicollis TaxID=283878 RepID=UPI002104F6C8|nr:ParB N-terminal domain-containing protein [Leucobacter aridicollis]UTX53277.1 ParB N-terminal domain-containing protein [Leucobacter aridicollis]